MLHCDGYRHLVGSGTDSWGWHLESATVHHGGQGITSCYCCYWSGIISLGTTYPNPGVAAPDTFTMILDLEAGTLAFSANNTYLGTAFSGLKGPLFPVVSSSWGYSEVALVYRFNSAHVDAALHPPLRRGGLAAKPLSLQELAREAIVVALDGRSVSNLGLPTRICR